MILEAEQSLLKTGKFVKAYPMELYDRSGELCAIVSNEIYIRDKMFTK
jgi:acyl-CoA thioesterase